MKISSYIQCAIIFSLFCLSTTFPSCFAAQRTRMPWDFTGNFVIQRTDKYLCSHDIDGGRKISEEVVYRGADTKQANEQGIIPGKYAYDQCWTKGCTLFQYALLTIPENLIQEYKRAWKQKKYSKALYFIDRYLRFEKKTQLKEYKIAQAIRCKAIEKVYGFESANNAYIDTLKKTAGYWERASFLEGYADFLFCYNECRLALRKLDDAARELGKKIPKAESNKIYWDEIQFSIMWGRVLIYAGTSDKQIRDGKKALKFAKQMHKKREKSRYFEANRHITDQCLAMAYAELGKFNKAVKHAKNGLKRYKERNKDASHLEYQLKNYRENKPIYYIPLNKSDNYNPAIE